MSRVRAELLRQRAEKVQARDALLTRVAEYDLDIDEIDVAVAAIDRNVDEFIAAEAAKHAPAPEERMTIQDMVIAVLSVMPGGAGTANEIRHEIKAQFGQDIDRTSLSPQLSRLKGNRVERMGKLWVLRDPEEIDPPAIVESKPGISVPEMLDALDSSWRGDASDLVHVHIGGRQ